MLSPIFALIMKKGHTRENTNQSVSNSRNLLDRFNISNPLSYFIIFAFAFLLYANTLGHQYAQDDAIVITDNMFTKKGIDGIPGLLKYDTFFGFFKVEGKAKLVSGGRYRPFTPIMFAIEYALVGQKPWLGHLMNIVWYGLLGILLFKTLKLLLRDHKMAYRNVMLLLATLLFVAHPIHTEVVANIKGRDEIMSLFGALGGFYFLLKALDRPGILNVIFSALLFFVGLLSKENTITFMAVVPLGLFLFRKEKFAKGIILMSGMFLATISFLIIRYNILGMDFGSDSRELMNNPYLKLVGNQFVDFDFSEKLATILFTLGKYLQLLSFPHPLTSDYYPRHIEIMSFGDVGVILSILLYVLILILALVTLKRFKIVSFSIFYYLITLSIVSNLVFPIGTNMSERFMFMPSIGFCLLIAWLGIRFLSSRPIVFAIVFGLMLSGFSIRTVDRNGVWYDDYNLFTTDIKTSSRSAKGLNSAGGAMIHQYEKSKNKDKNQLIEAKQYLDQAIEIHPYYKNAYLLHGNASFYLQEFEDAISSYEKALQIDPEFSDALNNLQVVYRDAGRFFGEKQGNLDKAIRYLNRSYEMKANDFETLRLLGVAHGINQDHQNAIKYFQLAVKANPNDAQSYMNLGNAHINAGLKDEAQTYFQQAIKLDPKIMEGKK